jgi:hypothetical protein
MSLSPALRSLLSVLEDETTNDVSKWRNMCFTQIMRLRIAEFHQFQEGVRYQQNRERLDSELTQVSGELDAVLEEKARLESALSKLVEIQRQLNDSGGERNSGTPSGSDLLAAVNNAPQFFRDIYRNHQSKCVPNVELRFGQANNEISALSRKISGVEHKLQTLIQMVQKRRSELAQGELLRKRLETELAELKQACSRIELPAFGPDIDRVASKYANSTEASTMLLTLENAIVELEAKISSIRLDNRPSECAILEGLIEKEKITHNALIQDLVEKYRTDGVDAECEEAQAAIQELSQKLQNERESIESQCSVISRKLKRRRERTRAEAIQNEETIKLLAEQIDSLTSRVPVRVEVPLVSVGTENVFSTPQSF